MVILVFLKVGPTVWRWNAALEREYNCVAGGQISTPRETTMNECADKR